MRLFPLAFVCVLGACAAGVIAGACTEYSEEASNDAGALDASEGGTGAADAGDAGDGALDDASRNADADADAGVDCTTRPRCDCDLDGYLARNCDAGTDQDAAALRDCDDSDPLRHPNAPFSSSIPPNTHDGDWDCDGTLEFATPQSITCTGSGMTGCGIVTGFMTAVPCGASGDRYRCEASGVLSPCQPKLDMAGVTQLCK